ncbi:hypothetical protein H2198_006359 [Neophaeococcomyces mojaviensis]|uniref:Uncharacterized protein n=1 Tax=Neophaeococcomyces mojaviensis TaxID=3383035 RepID=A0ACC3A312_9EURO|nr:hypothetical protein H2198_006359 [Knufia sp. JES_112]
MKVTQCVANAPNLIAISPSLPSRQSWDAVESIDTQQASQVSPQTPADRRRFSGSSSSTFAQSTAALRPETNHTGYTPALEAFKPIIQYSSPGYAAAISPVTQTTSITPGAAPYEWYDLVAQDAVKNVQNYEILKNTSSRWTFDPVTLSRSSAPSPSHFVHSRQNSNEHAGQQITRPPSTRGNGIIAHSNINKEPWNTSEPATLSPMELDYLKYYTDTVGPIFDLFDPERTFTDVIPHLALRNVGLLKSVLAVAARFKSLHALGRHRDNVQGLPQPHIPMTAATPSNTSTTATNTNNTSNFVDTSESHAIQFYYETLSYLSSAMQYPSYTRSPEILATAALLSSYESFHLRRSADWERHLKGVFWIQRSQETNGELSGIRGAVWWNWLRQDIWASLWLHRKPLTIWVPQKHVRDLKGHELASRAVYLLTKAIKYAVDDVRNSTDMNARMMEGDERLAELREWYDCLPVTYQPLPAARSEDEEGPPPVFPVVWIHPPFHAAAMQCYYAATILVLLNRPSVGGRVAYHESQRMLDEAVSMICGLAQSPTALEFKSLMVHFQALYVAGQCVRTKEQQKALYDIFDRVLEFNRFPTKSLLQDLEKVWETL